MTGSKEGSLSTGIGLGANYQTRNFDQAPPTYRDPNLTSAIIDATGLPSFSGSAIVVDLMSGPGLVVKGIKEGLPISGHRYIALDLADQQLRNVPEGTEVIRSDVRSLGLRPESADVAVVRYGIKDIPMKEQVGVLRGIYDTVKPGGRLVIADMVSPVGMQEFNNTQHSTKQQLSGRNIEEEGECHIPTQAEWLQLLRDAGFKAEVTSRLVSRVSTSNWVSSFQITSDQRELMDELFRSASDDVKQVFQIEEGEEGDIKIVYPILVIKAVKPAVDAI